jgi:acid stress-induced BolA-like protein IbaG/YrbA
MAQQRVIELPGFVGTLLAAVEQRFPGVQTDVERVKGADAYYYRIGLVSDLFSDIHLMARQELLWSIAEDVLDREQFLRISMFLALTPDELNGEEDPA